MGASSFPRRLASTAALALQLAGVSARDVNCACGYLDPVTNDLWTDTTILYFNETDAAGLSTNTDFIDLDFTNLYESGFDTIYRQAARAKNVGLNGTGALELTVDPFTKEHLVVGGGIRTARQDIQYGSFRAGMQPAQPGDGDGGSALSMFYRFNSSESIEIDLVNGPAGSNAFYHVDLPGTTISDKNYTFYNISQTGQTYELNQWRFDWTKEGIAYSNSLNSSNDYNITKKGKHLPSIPGPIYFKHWSNGAPSKSQGPPKTPAKAWIGYIRLFYNSSITSSDSVFGAQCSILQESVCSTEDDTLRISSEFSTDSIAKWKYVGNPYTAPKWALYGVIVSATIFGFCLVHAIIRRLFRHFSVPKKDRPVHPDAYTYKLDRFALHGELTRTMIKEKKRSEKAEKKAAARGDAPVVLTREIDPDAASLFSIATTAEPDGNSVRGFRSLAGNRNSKIIASALPTMYYARPGSSQGGRSGAQSGHARSHSRLNQTAGGSDDEDDDEAESMMESPPGSPRLRSNSDASEEDELDDAAEEAYANLPVRPSDEIDRDDNESAVAFRAATKELSPERKKSLFQNLEIKRPGQKFWRRFFSAAPTKAAEEKQAVLATASRIDYLDGLRGLCCLLVSLVHFSLTFYHGFISEDEESNLHYKFVKYIRYSISPFFFNANFGIGIFFILSSRLIGVRYLKTGLLQDLAGSTFRRIPRLAFPVLCSVILQYFLIGVGATQWLERLPSITWSTWPYAVEFQNPGWFINEYLALLFVQPPQLPEIIYNYCTGVLWTLPVSIQGSWLIFLGVIVVREIKTPWKRFGYYFFCMLNSWYALNWGAYFWIGLAISDLDVTYKYRTWGVKPWRSWLIVLSCFGIMALFMSSQWVQQFSSFSLPTFENAIHPDLRTGLPIGQTSRYGYPTFNLPQVHSLFAATAVMLLVDFSATWQRILRMKLLRALGYYSYSVYLLHGLVFWSWGAWLAVVMSTKGVPYWANILVVFLTSYTLLALSIYLWTPFADVFSGYAGTALWRRAQGRSFFATIG